MARFRGNTVYAHTILIFLPCSQYQINVSENYSSLSLYDGLDYTEFSALAHIPLRPPNDYYTLSEVLNNGQSLDGSAVNILAIVRHVRSQYL